jgi:hypothetical protein
LPVNIYKNKGEKKMKINLETNQILNKEQVKILKKIANVTIAHIKYDPTEWDNLSIICIDDINIIYIVESIEPIILKECMLYENRIFSTVIGNVEKLNNYVIVKTL